MGIGGRIKTMARNFFNFGTGFAAPRGQSGLRIEEALSHDLNVLRNRVWFRGDKAELEQFYGAVGDFTGNTMFWAKQSSHGINFRKIHTGLPGLIVRMLTGIAVGDLIGITVNGADEQKCWDEIASSANFNRLLEFAVQETLVTQDGAFKISVDANELPVIEFFGADRVEFVYDCGRLKEIIYKTEYERGYKKYLLKETYGRGYITNALFDERNAEVPISVLADTADLKDVEYDGGFIMGVPFIIYQSARQSGRGRSVFDGKYDVFDALDECVSQWIDELRTGRVKVFIPESMIPRGNGAAMDFNSFDANFIMKNDLLMEGVAPKIETVQPEIRTEAFLQSYITFLDLALQGIIAPSTLGIDVKKLDNAEAQREKEKVTMYTHGKIVGALSEVVPLLVETVLKTRDVAKGFEPGNYTAGISFGEYANPSFEAVIETVGKGVASGVMSVERAVEELYGDRLTAAEKQIEAERLNAAAEKNGREWRV